MCPGAIVAGTEAEFFTNLSQNAGAKRKIDTSLKVPGRVPAGTELILDNVGLYVLSAFGNLLATPSDIKRVIDGAYFEFTINGIVQAEGPAINFHSGLGFAGNTVENGQGIVSIGTPATGAVAKLEIPQLITKDNDIKATLRWDDRIWAGTGAAPLVFPVLADRMPVASTGMAIRLVLAGQLIIASTK